MADGMLDGLFGALNVGADIDYGASEKDEKNDREEMKEKHEEQEDRKDHSTMEDLPRSMDPHKMYGSKFDEWVKQNRPDYKN